MGRYSYTCVGTEEARDPRLQRRTAIYEMRPTPERRLYRPRPEYVEPIRCPIKGAAIRGCERGQSLRK